MGVFGSYTESIKELQGMIEEAKAEGDYSATTVLIKAIRRLTMSLEKERLIFEANNETRLNAGAFKKDANGDWREHYADENEYRPAPRYWCAGCGVRRVGALDGHCDDCQPIHKNGTN